jgi:ABC-2 type transport system permease protein
MPFTEMAGAGPLGTLARAQYGALARLRWHMFTNGLRSSKGTFELGARILVYFLYAVLGLGLGLGMSAGAYAIALNQAWEYLPILFWVAFLIWQMIPIMLASFQEQFDLGSILRFPVSFGSFFLLYLVFGLVDISTICGACCCFGIWSGISVARPELLGWTALGLAVFAVFNILLVRAIFAWIDRWLSQRKTREILAAVFLVIALCLQLLNPALYRSSHGKRPSRDEQAETYRKMGGDITPWLKTANAVQEWLPPGLAARALTQAAKTQLAPAWGSIGVLGLYLLAAGGVLAARLRAEYRGENLGYAPRRNKASPRRRRVSSPKEIAVRVGNPGWFLDGSGPIAAVMEKELRTLMRSIPQLYVLGAPLLMVFIFGALFRSSASGGHMFALALPLSMAYAMLGFTQLFSNNLGHEGAGIQVIFLSPTPIRTVFLAKNLFHAFLLCLDVLLAGILVSLRLGRQDGAELTATIAWLLFALPVNLAVGNVFSLTMPYRVNPGRLTRQRGSQGNALLSLLVQLGVLGVGAVVFGLCGYLRNLWLATPIFLVLAAGAVSAWMRVLRNTDGMANRRRDSLIETLVKAD